MQSRYRSVRVSQSVGLWRRGANCGSAPLLSLRTHRTGGGPDPDPDPAPPQSSGLVRQWWGCCGPPAPPSPPSGRTLCRLLLRTHCCTLSAASRPPPPPPSHCWWCCCWRRGRWWWRWWASLLFQATVLAEPLFSAGESKLVRWRLALVKLQTLTWTEVRTETASLIWIISRHCWRMRWGRGVNLRQVQPTWTQSTGKQTFFSLELFQRL